MQDLAQDKNQTNQETLKPFTDADLDALFTPRESTESEAVNVGRSYYGGEWGPKKKK